MTQPTPTSVSRIQRVIAYMIAAMVIVSVIAFVVILGAAYFGASGEFDRGVWPVVALVPLIALPLAVVGWIALLVVSLRRRALETAERERIAVSRSAQSSSRSAKGSPRSRTNASRPSDRAAQKKSAPGRTKSPGSSRNPSA